MATKTSKRKKINFEDFIFGRSMPHDIELEKAVLGAILIERPTINIVQRYLKEGKVFYHDAHQIIYRAILSCIEKYNEVDIIIVTNELRRLGELDSVGGAFYITQLTNSVVSNAHVISHCLLLYEKYISRQLLMASGEIAQRAYNDTDDPFVTLEEALSILDDVKVSIAAMKNEDFKKQIHDTMKTIEEAGKHQSIGISTGLSNVDRIIGGRVKGELSIIAARPSMGKTARMIQEAMNISIGAHIKTGIISMEMTAVQLIVRMLSNMSRIDSQLIRMGRISDHNWKQLVDVSGRLADTNLYINESGNLTITDIRGVIRHWVDVEKVEIVFIDYLGLIKYQNMNGKPIEEISKITRGLKTIAIECNIPIVALSQLNREVERRTDKYPILSDLRDSGSIEQDSDVVSFLYRPEYYGITQDENGESTMNLCEENIAKNRNGAIGKCAHRYIKETNEFEPFGNTISGAVQNNERIIKIPVSSQELKEDAADAVASPDDLPW